MLTVSGAVQVWHIYAVTFLNSSLSSISQPGRRAIIAGLVPRHHLMNALALNQSQVQLSRILAPSLAGIRIATVALSVTYFVNGGATLITALWLLFVKVPPLPERPKASPLQDLMEGDGRLIRLPRKRGRLQLLLDVARKLLDDLLGLSLDDELPERGNFAQHLDLSFHSQRGSIGTRITQRDSQVNPLRNAQMGITPTGLDTHALHRLGLFDLDVQIETDPVRPHVIFETRPVALASLDLLDTHTSGQATAEALRVPDKRPSIRQCSRYLN